LRSSSEFFKKPYIVAICFVLRNSIYAVVVATVYCRVSKDENALVVVILALFMRPWDAMLKLIEAMN